MIVASGRVSGASDAHAYQPRPNGRPLLTPMVHAAVAFDVAVVCTDDLTMPPFALLAHAAVSLNAVLHMAIGKGR